MLVVTCLTATACSTSPTESALPEPTSVTFEQSAPDRSQPPVVAGTALPVLDRNERPETPVQWGGGGGAVPSGRWWSSLAAEEGILALWSYPLLLRSEPDGRVSVGSPTLRIRDDGYPDAETVPTVFLELGDDVRMSVLDEGAFHVRFSVITETANLTATITQGSPLLELDGTGTLPMTIPALGALEPSVVPGVLTMTTSTGSWLAASESGTAADWRLDGDRADIDFGSGSRWVLGPAPTVAARYLEAVHAVAKSPLMTTVETLELTDGESVRQILRQAREPAPGQLPWVLLPHQSDHLQPNLSSSVASMDTPKGTLDVVVAPELALDYPAVPILWNPVVVGTASGQARVGDLPPVSDGSYFGGKYAYTAALASQLRGDDADDFLAIADQAVMALVARSRKPHIAWEPHWGSVVVSPAEFGSAVDLNDHQLQYGYWVAAASILASAANGDIDGHLRDAIDLMIADYGGGETVPQWQGVVADRSSWSAYDGHSWASGTSRFSAGNNLESISESSFAWWAAARWFIATGRPELADQFLARLTIESWRTQYEWLPTTEHQWANVRPWSGVVWASKIDPGTWFHASAEAALGIRLLPVGPQSFSRYVDPDSIRAASTRWEWCDRAPSQCLERWGNLLDSDAAVAGRLELRPTADPEESTLRAIAQWWRVHWETATFADSWRCTAGALARLRPDGTVVAILSNPGPVDLPARCQSLDGEVIYETIISPFSDRTEPIGPG